MPRGRHPNSRANLRPNKRGPARATHEIKTWSRGLLEDPDYRAALVKRLKAGTAPTIEALLYAYGYGKPKEQVEISSGLAPLIVEVTGIAPPGDE